MLKASELDAIVKEDRDWFERRNDVDQIIEALDLDAGPSVLDLSIYLRDKGRYWQALKLLARLLDKNPNDDGAYYQSALNSAFSGDLNNAIWLAQNAVRIAPHGHASRSLLARCLATMGETPRARRVLLEAHETQVAIRAYFERISQFIDFCEDFPLQRAEEALANLRLSGSYLEVDGVHHHILGALQERRPFSLVRLGDGEGAWLSFNSYDEGRFGALYRGNRIEFLRDWFGSDKLINSDDFFRFSVELQGGFATHDIIGIAPQERLDQEKGFASMRGITSSVNVFRYLDLLHGRSSLKLCSNSINLALGNTSFYRDLLNTAVRVNLITSHSGLPDMIRARGATVDEVFIIPGDSRNFYRAEGSDEPLCQYPIFLNEIEDRLKSRMHHGEVWLVAAGYVGKKYIKTIRERGGFVFDLGSLADHWARHGAP